jgi:branched-chain amino acid transport system substrate-binding protein
MAAGLVALGAAGCGGDDETSSAGGSSGEEKAPITVGLIGARVGPIANIGTGIGEGLKDWIEYTNSKGGANGHPIKLVEIESQYEVPRGLEVYQRLKQEKATAIVVAGTAISVAVTPLAATDKIPLIYPGQGNAQSTDGKKFPYGFPLAPTYPDQASAALKAFVDGFKGEGKPKVACIGWDAPPGKEYCDALEKAAGELGAEVVVNNAVSVKALDATPQVLEVKRAQPDATFHSTAFKQAASVLSAYCNEDVKGPLYTWHWALSENEIKAAGAECAEKAQYGGTGMARLPSTDPEGLELLRAWWKEEGKQNNEVSENNQVYGNGLAIGQLVVEGVTKAAEAAGDGEVTSETLKQGLESIKDFDANGSLCPTTVTADDHGGNRSLFVYRFEGQEFTLAQECVEGPAIAAGG